MRVKKVIAGVFLFVAVMFGSAVDAADQRDFTIVNATGYPIKFLGVNEPSDPVYNENELSGILGNGASFKVKFSNADKGCSWNIKVTWADDNTSSIFKGLDLCKINTVTLKYNKQTDVASYTTD
jgi:hypothetical protein